MVWTGRNSPQCSTEAVADCGQTASLGGTQVHLSSLGGASLWEFQQLQPEVCRWNSDLPGMEPLWGRATVVSSSADSSFLPAGSEESRQHGHGGFQPVQCTHSGKGQPKCFIKQVPDPMLTDWVRSHNKVCQTSHTGEFQLASGFCPSGKELSEEGAGSHFSCSAASTGDSFR